MKDRLLASGEARRLLGIPHATLHSWVERGFITPAVPGKGLGTCLMLTIPQTLGIAIGRSLRRSGFSLDIAGAVSKAVMSLSQESLDSALAQGRRCLVIAGGKCFPLLIPRSAIETNPELKARLKAATELGDVAGPTVVDIQPAYQQLLAAIETLDAEQAETQRTKQKA